MFLKGLIAAVLESSEPLHLLRLNGRVGAIPVHRESTDSLIFILYYIISPYMHCYTPLWVNCKETFEIT